MGDVGADVHDVGRTYRTGGGSLTRTNNPISPMSGDHCGEPDHPAPAEPCQGRAGQDRRPCRCPDRRRRQDRGAPAERAREEFREEIRILGGCGGGGVGWQAQAGVGHPAPGCERSASRGRGAGLRRPDPRNAAHGCRGGRACGERAFRRTPGRRGPPRRRAGTAQGRGRGHAAGPIQLCRGQGGAQGEERARVQHRLDRGRQPHRRRRPRDHGSPGGRP